MKNKKEVPFAPGILMVLLGALLIFVGALIFLSEGAGVPTFLLSAAGVIAAFLGGVYLISAGSSKKPSMPRKISWIGWSLLFLVACAAGRWYYVWFYDGWNIESVIFSSVAIAAAIVGVIALNLSLSAKAGVGMGPDG